MGWYRLDGKRRPGALGSFWETVQGTIQDLGARIASGPDVPYDTVAIWASVGKPLTGIGGATYKLTSEHLIIEKGFLAGKGRRIHVRDIYEVSSAQNMSQKVRGLGSIVLRVVGENGVERIVLEDLPDFHQGATMIGNVVSQAQAAEETDDSDTHIHRVKAQTPPTEPPAPEQEPSELTESGAKDQQAGVTGLNVELLRLAQLHKDGILTDEEFAAAKAKLLGL